MANQHKTGEAVYRKCINPDCREKVRITPSRQGKKHYCSRKCRYDCMPSPLIEERGEWVIQNLHMEFKDMAAHFNCSLGTFTHLLDRMRRKGYAVPMRKGKYAPKKAKKSRKRKSNTKTISMPQTSNDRRKERVGPAQRAHMDHKPPVEGAKFKPEDKPFKTRKVVDGPIKIFFKDKNKTKFTATDKAHMERILKTYAHFGEYYVTGLPDSDAA